MPPFRTNSVKNIEAGIGQVQGVSRGVSDIPFAQEKNPRTFVDKLNGAGKAKGLLLFGLDTWAWEGMGRTEKFQVFQICGSSVTVATSGVNQNISSREINSSIQRSLEDRDVGGK